MMQTHGRLSGKVAVVTGGTKGIGQGIVLRFLKEGAAVVYCSRSPENNRENEALIAQLSGAAERAQFVAADVGNRQQMEDLVNNAAERFGRLDIVVNNAQGIAPVRSIENKPDADYRMTLMTGFYQSLWTSRAAVPHMRKVGGGRLIYFSSHWNIWGQPYASDYNITKSANEALTRSAAREFGKDNITVNCITPAGDSWAYKSWADQNREMAEASVRQFPMRRMGDCEIDIAGAVLGLCSDNGRFITGQVFCVDGGAWATAPLQMHEEGTDIHKEHSQAAVELTA
ncbi:SDR family oxidoreductase [Sphingobium fuliginis]|jgi:NAD(P)-dependent dehydrogenase (short-subunit alcohol dehydrogenase family)|uniref:SDR family oxidoreductase n=2 Tax=Sphingobium fuliginis (strain ATCC 27551) TaxID=336203 RepID=A0A4Q4IX08_SPHSA|nr:MULTISPECIES: SDR family oxidoreductase [Sphingobium]QOT74154.1 SDR family oxidoreductase [Sphingobium fuliginis]RYL98161.1 SDR family oxidoreductase [Sphingobium fuliginis]WDA34873.1 SDR family NAD(P)-dependent oxidoreductase [Sphingobium sp. YC-XJ3]